MKHQKTPIKFSTNKKTVFKKFLISIVSIIFLSSITIFTGCNKKDSETAIIQETTEKIHVKYADCGWDSIRFLDAVAIYIGETAYNIEGEEVATSTPIAITGVQDNEIQVITEFWADNYPDYPEKLEANSLQEMGIVYNDNIQGLYVPRYVVEGDTERGIKASAPGLRTVKDLSKYASVFPDPEDSSKGRIYGSISGWGADPILRKKIVAYGLDQYYNYADPGSDSALAASIASAYEKGKPILAYNWSPNWISGKYDLICLDDTPYNEAGYSIGISAFPSMNLPIVVSNEFAETAPEYCDFLRKFNTSAIMISKALAYMQETKCTTAEAAIWYFQNFEEEWTTWLPEDKAEIIKASLGLDQSEKTNNFIHFPENISLDIKTPIDTIIAYQVEHWSGFFDGQKFVLGGLITGVGTAVKIIPWWVLILLIAFASWKTSRSWKKPLLYSILLLFIGAIGLWDLMNETLTIVIVSVFISLLFGLPIGVLTSGSQRATRIVRPILDTMQTLPSFVYLIPAVMLLGIGNIPAIIATTIYALPPVVRLTSHGIRQVDKEIVEAAKSFGSTKWQTLIKVQIPQAMPTIMTGINQTIMMAISMVVTCSMIGATGLGSEVIKGINRLESGRGFAAGIAIVIIAIIIDRLTQAAFKKNNANFTTGAK
jgi:glycine betaine/proline transport system permease protein/glycine betaine/proline transport system substrate-binding protein